MIKMIRLKFDRKIQFFLVGIGILITLWFFYKGFYFPKEKKGAQFFLAFEMFLGVLLLFIPDLIRGMFKYELPASIKILYWLFVYFAVFIGTGFSFYGKIHYWDKLLHISSSMLLTALAFSLLGTFIRKDLMGQIHPIIYALFACCFGISMGVLWEFYEFTFDGLLGMNMQRFAAHGKPLVGREALFDTMGDLFIDALGSILFAGYGYWQLKQEPLWLDTIRMHKSEKKR